MNVLFNLIDDKKTIDSMRIDEKFLLSEVLWKKLPYFFNKIELDKVESLAVSYIPGTVRYSRLRLLFTIINVFGIYDKNSHKL